MFFNPFATFLPALYTNLFALIFFQVALSTPADLRASASFLPCLMLYATQIATSASEAFVVAA
jgi:hypothetical protein